MAVSPINPQIVLVGAGTGGIWRSTDGGATFVPVSDDHIDVAIGWIAFSPSSPSTVYAGLGDPQTRGSGGLNSYFGSGILKSVDAGATWTRINDDSFPAAAQVTRLIVDPVDADRIYVTVRTIRQGNTTAFGGFYLSTNGGISWTRSRTTTAWDLVIHPTTRTLFMAAFGGLYRSTNLGMQWQLVLEAAAGRQHVAIAPSDPQTLYVGFKETSGYRLFVSSDGGATWSPKPAPPTDMYSKMSEYLAVDPADPRVVYHGGEDLWRSDDGGDTWTNLSRRVAPSNPTVAGLHVDQCAIAFSSDDAGTVYFANDGGLYRSRDRGNTFESLNQTLSLAQFYTLVVHPANPSLVIGGTQDNGPQLARDGAEEWRNLRRGDVGAIVIDPADTNYVYFAGNFGFGIVRHRNRGDTFDRVISDSITDTVQLMPALAASRTGVLYFGTWRLWSSINRGDTWTPGQEDLTRGHAAGDALKVIAVSQIDSSVLYTGSHLGRVMVSRNAGTTWTDRTGTLPDRAIQSIVTDAPTAATAYVTVSGFGSGHVFKTTDYGESWTAISGNLPDVPANALLVDPANPATLYVGTDAGVFRSTSGGGDWSGYNAGLPPAAIVTSFAVQPGSPIRLATYGRGAYELTRPAPLSARTPIRALLRRR